MRGKYTYKETQEVTQIQRWLYREHRYSIFYTGTAFLTERHSTVHICSFVNTKIFNTARNPPAPVTAVERKSEDVIASADHIAIIAI